MSKEFRAALPILGFDSSCTPAIDELFDALDADGGGTVRFVVPLPPWRPDARPSTGHAKRSPSHVCFAAIGSQIDHKELHAKLRQGGDIELDATLQVGGAGEIELESKNKGFAIRKDVSERAVALKPVSVDALRQALLGGLTRVIDAFRLLDRNKDGTVTKKEFRGALPMLGFDGSDNTLIDELFEELDEDHSGASQSLLPRPSPYKWLRTKFVHGRLCSQPNRFCWGRLSSAIRFG